MTDFIKQAREYFEQNPDQDEYFIRHPYDPNYFRSITRWKAENYEKIKSLFIDIAMTEENDFLWNLKLKLKPDHE